MSIDDENKKSYRDYIEEVDLQRYWLVLKRRWLPAAVVFVSCATGAVLFASSGEPIYQSQGSLLFQRERSTSLTGAGQGIGDIGGTVASRSDPLQSQAAIIQSQSVLGDVVEDLRLQDSEGNPLSVSTIRSGLIVTRQKDTDILRVFYQSPDPERAAAIVNQVMASYIERNIILNRLEATAAREFIQSQIPKAEGEFKQASNALTEFYVQNQIVDLESEVKAAVDFTNLANQEIAVLQSDLADLNTRDNELRSLLGMPLEQARQIDTLTNSPGVQDVLEQLQEVQIAVAQQQGGFTENHPTIAKLRREEASLQSLLGEKVSEALMQEELISPEGQSLALGNLQMSDLNRRIANQLVEVQVDRLSLISRLQVLEENRREYFSAFNDFPKLEEQERELQQRLRIAEKNYEDLLTRYQQARLAESQVLASAEIIEQGDVPKFPLATQNTKILIAGILASALLGVTAAFLLDLVDRSIKTAKDGEVLLGYTLLGLIPKYFPENADGYTAGAGERSPYIVSIDANQMRTAAHQMLHASETQLMAMAAYEMLFANLKFVTSSSSRSVITVTSSVPEEGKSTVSANLATTMAQSGKNVLLVDADMRSPSQHLLWNVSNRVGLSHVLVGEVKLSEASKEIDENFTLLTAGLVPPNPLELLDSPQMANLIESLSEKFDYVIFDTPPLVGAADAATLGKKTDGVLLVFRPRLVDTSSAFAAKALLKRSEAEVLGIVANHVDIRHEHGDYVSQVKAGSYPYGQNIASEAKKKNRLAVPFKQ